MELIFWNIYQKFLHTLTNIEVIVIAVTVAADGLKACSSKIPTLAQPAYPLLTLSLYGLLRKNRWLFFKKLSVLSLNSKTAVKVERKGCQILHLTVEIVVSSFKIKLQLNRPGSGKNRWHLVSHDSLIITWVLVIGKKHNQDHCLDESIILQ